MKDPVFRVSAKAIIVEDDRLLVIHLRDDLGDFYYLPGGGQEYGETIAEALDRECREEIGCGVVHHEIIFLRDYFGWEYEFADIEGHIHQVELMFQCDIAEAQRPTTTSVPDEMQVGFTWVPITDLPTTRFYPMAMRDELVDALRSPEPLPGRYLGSVN